MSQRVTSRQAPCARPSFRPSFPRRPLRPPWLPRRRPVVSVSVSVLYCIVLYWIGQLCLCCACVRVWLLCGAVVVCDLGTAVAVLYLRLLRWLCCCVLA